MKKLIMILLLGIFMVGLVSSFEFDNVKNYNHDSRELIIENGFGIGGDVAKIKLTSPLIVKVPQGYQKVAEFELTYYKDNNGGLDKMEFFDIRNSMSKINREFDYKVKTIEDVVVVDYETTCENNQTGNGKCVRKIIGNHIEEQIVWKDLNYSNINKGEQITIGIFTDVQQDDHVEWIPTFYGVEIDEWAIWTSNLNVDLIGYWKLDDNESTTNVIDSFANSIDGTSANNTENFSSPGRINNSFDFNGTLEEFVSIDGIPSHINSNTTGTWAFWMFMPDTSTAGQKHIIMFGSAGGLAAFVRINADGRLDVGFTNKWEFNTDDVLSDGVWHNVVIVQNGTSPILYVDNVSVDITFTGTNDVTAWFNDEIDFDLFSIARFHHGSFTGDYYTGKVDELIIWSRPLSVSEINQLYNDGSGITILSISLNSPVDNFISNNQTIDFNCSLTTLSTINNVSLIINDEINQTNSSGTSGDYIFTTTLSNGNFNWSCNATVDDEKFTSFSRSLTIDTLSPRINITAPLSIINYNIIGSNETLNVTFTDTSLNTCWFNYNGTNITMDGCLTGIQNSTNFLLESNNLNMTVYANDTFGNENSTFINWTYKVLELNRTFNTSVFETSSQTFIINVSANASLTAVNLFYDGTSKTTTLSNNVSTVSFDIPASIGDKSLFWNFIYGDETINSTTSNQTVNAITFGFCNSTLNVPYINFTFKNETTNQELVNATIDSTWNVWIGSGTTSKQFTLTNSTENANYSMCFSASNNTANTNVTLVYNNANSQQRIFVSEPILTNSTTLQTLFLLPSTLGLFGQFQTRDVSNNPIALVRGVISRTLGSSIVNVASSFTDSSGIVIFFLNPDVLYTATFSKTGFANNIFTFVPTTDLRFVTMGGTTSVNGSDISIGTLYQITPSNSTLTNNTLTTFGFNVTGASNITFISMNITDGNVTSFSFDSNAGTGFISTILNTSENKTMVGIYEIRTPNENLTFSRVWTIGNEFEGDYSIAKQGRLFLEYEFSDFIRLAFVILIMFGVVIFMSSNELADNNESKIAVIVLLIWAFSVIGWLNNPAAVSTTGIAQYARQYGIAILSTAGAVFFFIRRIFI